MIEENMTNEVRMKIGAIYRDESRRVLATLVRLLGDLDAAEEAMHDAFAAALLQWPRDGIPKNQRAWLVSTGRFKAIDRMRRRAHFDAAVDALGRGLAESQRLSSTPAAGSVSSRSPYEPDEIDDDRLRLIFLCAHPSLSLDARVALTLREVCDLTTEEIARAFLVSTPTIAQRIVRAKARIRSIRLPYEVPPLSRLRARLECVLHVIYLVFNEGYFASSGDSLTRPDLSGEAIRLGRLLVELLPDPEAVGLLALMLLHDSRRLTRTSESGEIVLLEDQDRSKWNREQITQGVKLVPKALKSPSVGPYALQAAIAALHAEAQDSASTDWVEIVGLYDVLIGVTPSPVVELNRAVAIAMRDGWAAGLDLVDTILARGELDSYHLAHSARGELCRRLGRNDEARASFARALDLAELEPERRLIRRRLSELPS